MFSDSFYCGDLVPELRLTSHRMGNNNVASERGGEWRLVTDA